MHYSRPVSVFISRGVPEASEMFMLQLLVKEVTPSLHLSLICSKENNSDSEVCNVTAEPLGSIA